MVDELLNKLLSVKIDLPEPEDLNIEISKNLKDDFTVEYTLVEYSVWIEESEDSLSGEFGSGKTVEEALLDYIKRVNGKRLVVEIDDKEYLSDVINI